MRGAQKLHTRNVLHTGIIPACAGSTRRAVAWYQYATGSSPHVRGAPAKVSVAVAGVGDHPRMCGEHKSPTRLSLSNQGSSPHVRGARVHQRPPRSRTGIIPACAGSTVWLYNNGTEDVGSSPHVRGAHSPLHAHQGRRGIIPACAGSTVRSRFNAIRSRDHPRMCGEHLSYSRFCNAVMGSSPHVRGAHLRGA